MRLRVLCIAIVLLASPVTTWAASHCCQVDESCCGDERQSCPATAGGECSIAAAGHALATVAHAPDPLGLVPAAAARIAPRLRLAGTLAGARPELPPPRFSLLQPLRI